jgi:hypothetical protein
VYDPALSIEDSFVRAKTFNVALSLVLLAGLFVAWRPTLPAIQNASLLLVTAFTVFLFKAAFVQAELVYYVLAFGSFLLLCKLLAKPSWPLAVVTGLCVAGAHLAKAAAIPTLVAFLFIWMLRASSRFYRARTADSGGWRSAMRPAAREAGIPAIVVATFILGVLPYLITSERVFGSAFYNVQSTFYVWYDSWAEARGGTIRAGDRFGLPALPAEALPGPRTYFREHTLRDVAIRLADGLRWIFGQGVRTYGYWKYVVFYGVAVLAVVAARRRWALEQLREHFFVVAFTLLYVGGYTLAYAWHVPIAGGNRLILALFLPSMYAAARVLHERASEERSPGAGGHPWWFMAVHLAMIASVALELPDILGDRIETVYGGE